MVHILKPSKFHLEVNGPTGTIFAGDVKAATLINELGPFDVVEKHTNFISAIREKIIIYLLDDQTKEIPIELGIIKITRKGVEIFLGIEAVPEKIQKPLPV